jgi:hypothetical protein
MFCTAITICNSLKLRLMNGHHGILPSVIVCVITPITQDGNHSHNEHITVNSENLGAPGHGAVENIDI